MHQAVTPTPKKKGPKHSYRLHVTEDILSSYLNLSENGRVYFEQFLALQVYGDAGMDHYTPGRNRQRSESVDQHVMCECVTMTIHESWAEWAKMITKANLSEFERREAVREMLGALISQKNKSCVNDSELREAAEKALEWTIRDAQNCTDSRLVNSHEYRTCIKAIATAGNRTEAIKQLDALHRKARVER